jgi:hypothetical protein
VSPLCLKVYEDGVRDTKRVENVIQKVREKADVYGANKDMVEAIYIGGVNMATSSITKDFTIKDKKVFDNLVKEINKPSKEHQVNTSYLEEGKKLLAQYFYL